MYLERLVFFFATIILTIFIGKLILMDAFNLVPIFATIGWLTCALGTINYDDW